MSPPASEPAARCRPVGPTRDLARPRDRGRRPRAGRGCVFDPLLRARARAAGKVDAVLVTHSHVDHLNRWSLKAIDRDTHLVVPARRAARRRRPRVREGHRGDRRRPARRSAASRSAPSRPATTTGRWRKSDAPEALGYVVRGGGVDASTTPATSTSPITRCSTTSASGSRSTPRCCRSAGCCRSGTTAGAGTALDRGVHIDPDCALDIYERLGAKALVPVHWGTVHLRLGPPSMPRRRLAKVAAASAASDRRRRSSPTASARARRRRASRRHTHAVELQTARARRSRRSSCRST